jgi:predicted transposase/invertase (TIGR01784 family)
MSFDTTCRRLAEIFPQDFASWLLGRPIALTELKPTELSLEAIRADCLILLQGENEVLHIEWQTVPTLDLPMRLADYRLRIHRKFPTKTIHQVVIYLRETKSERVFQNYFEIAGMYAEFDVVRIWEVPAKDLLRYPGLLAFAALGRSTDPVKTLRSAVTAIGKIKDAAQQHEAISAAYVLSGLRLEADVISKMIRRDVMQESVTYQAILAEGEQIGIEKGREEGREEGRERTQRSIALQLLNEQISIEIICKVTGLSIEQIETLRLELQ